MASFLSSLTSFFSPTPSATLDDSATSSLTVASKLEESVASLASISAALNEARTALATNVKMAASLELNILAHLPPSVSAITQVYNLPKLSSCRCGPCSAPPPSPPCLLVPLISSHRELSVNIQVQKYHVIDLDKKRRAIEEIVEGVHLDMERLEDLTTLAAQEDTDETPV